ncbi:TetR/AcrR family transcriptional regulator [Jeotgalibacillus sp. R-1-5s-1]|uniref:TetR/AcrR family transcriptional regulator n=1 Tax=Jeotgalibacillus sp. R-1-5s-1 TaxID=2555897 RepID=UPI00106C300C|nr:TetR/AcrR family transcriptional regulator [Jeotgalibacillus sp. R-1-5s-1]TFD92461.1 TetR/AcrR family transcriptional regulator [Jeotgalibacillus sp. R-1-5s-1]
MKKDKPKYKMIIDAAVVVIAENGYHHAQVSKIAKQAGVADGTIYLYFKNKEDILISLFEEKMGQFVQSIRKRMSDKTDAIDQLKILVDSHFNMLAEDHHLAIVTQLELRQSNKDIRLRINKVLKEYLVLVDEVLQNGVDNGVLSEDLDIRLARQMVFGTIDEVATSWVINDQKYSITDLAPGVHTLLVKGLRK